jgi:DNA-binding NarL/FixJ family response regulator
MEESALEVSRNTEELLLVSDETRGEDRGDRDNGRGTVLRTGLPAGVSEFDRTAVLLDHHPLWLDAVERVVNRVGVDVVGKATSTDQALALLEQHQPDIFVAEIQTTDETIAAVSLPRIVTDHSPETKTIVLSENEERDFIEATLQAGAVAYVVKSVHPDDLTTTVRQVFEHSVYLPSSKTQNAALLQRKREQSPLTRREMEILRLTAEGYSNAQMAKMLWVTEQTVKFHLSNIYRKLDVSNRTEASRWAQLNGMLFSASSVGL